MSSPSSSSSWTLSPDTSLDSDTSPQAEPDSEWGTSSSSTITPNTFRSRLSRSPPPSSPQAFSTPSPSFSHSSLSSSPGSNQGGAPRSSLDRAIPLPEIEMPTPPRVQAIVIADTLAFEDMPHNMIDLSHFPANSAIHPRWQCSDIGNDGRSQLATSPGYNKILLVNRLLPWSISITASSLKGAVTVGDILGGLHRALFTPVTEAEYNQSTLERQQMIAKAYQERVSRRGDPESQGKGCLRRIDYLEGKWRFAGLSPINSSSSQHILRFSVRP